MVIFVFSQEESCHVKHFLLRFPQPWRVGGGRLLGCFYDMQEKARKIIGDFLGVNKDEIIAFLNKKINQ